MTTLNLPAKMEFTMGSTEQKMDMTLDDIIKLGRRAGQKKQRVPIKSQNRPRNVSTNGNGNANSSVARAVLQRSVAVRSARIRQGKLAEARARNGAGKLPVTQAAGKRAFAAPVRTRGRQWMKSSDVRRNNINRPGAGQGPKPNGYSAAAGNMKISVFNNGSKFGGQRPSAVQSRRRNGSNNPSRRVQTVGFNAQSMEVEYAPQTQPQRQKARTLDALFAEIKERRNNQQPQIVQPLGVPERNHRRGGRGGFAARGRGGH